MDYFSFCKHFASADHITVPPHYTKANFSVYLFPFVVCLNFSHIIAVQSNHIYCLILEYALKAGIHNVIAPTPDIIDTTKDTTPLESLIP